MKPAEFQLPEEFQDESPAEFHELDEFQDELEFQELDAFHDWVVARRGETLHRRHKLVSYFTEGGTTEAQNAALRSQLEREGVLCEYEPEEGLLSRRDLSHADAVFVRTGLGHSDVPWETNALRDCLFASALPRHLPTTWFARKTGARPLDRRPR